NGADVVHLATGLVVGYPPCPYIRQFKAFIEKQYGLPVVVGTHPIPLKYLQTHNQLPFWEQGNMKDIAGHLLAETHEVMRSEEHTSELQSLTNLVCRLLLEKKK